MYKLRTCLLWLFRIVDQGVAPTSEEDKKDMEAFPLDEAAELKDIGASGYYGEAGFSTLERRWVRPTLEVHPGHTILDHDLLHRYLSPSAFSDRLLPFVLKLARFAYAIAIRWSGCGGASPATD
jgi:hypothetical protein